MPLRTSLSFDHKSRIKMAAQKGHYVKMKKPTGPELYEDASRILEELLQRQVQGLNRHGPSGRYRSHPGPGRRRFQPDTLDERDELGLDDGGIERCKTMPSRMRGASKDEPLHPKDLDTIEKKSKRGFPGENGSVSSADTEGDSEIVSKDRKKKSLLQKAKGRFLHAIHREERDKKLKGKDSPKKDKDSPKNSSKKLKKKTPSKEKDLDKNGVTKFSHQGDKRRGTLDSQNGSPRSQTDSLEKRRNTAGQAFFDTIRKSFSLKKRHSPQDDSGDRFKSASSSAGGMSGSSKSATPSPDKYFTAHGPSTSPHDTSNFPSKFPRDNSGFPSSGGSLLVPGRKESSVSPFPHSSSTESHRNGEDKSSSLYSITSVHQNGSNVLDDPDDDIPFMDSDYDHGGAAKVLLPGGIRPPGSGRTKYTRHCSLVPDGESEIDEKDGKGDKPHVGPDGDDIPFHERTSKEKDEMYSKIAKKLIDIGENYAAESGMSDSDGHGREAMGQASAGDGVLTDLEREILECLRNLGDSNTHVVDEHAQAAIEKAKAETYQRFKKTMQHSLGEEVSWNQLAFLFYTTKGVVSAVGKGSQIAGEVKEMTLRYFSEKFATWIMDRGGFDSMLSESDSELD